MVQKVYHAHIPKTAGTSLNSWLNDGVSADRAKPDDFDGMLTRWLKARGVPGIRSANTVSASCWEIYDVLHGHRNLMYGRGPDSIVLTIFREPVARSISLFYDLASLEEDKLAHLTGQTLAYRRDCLRLSFAQVREKWSRSILFLGQHHDYMCRFFLRNELATKDFFRLGAPERFRRAAQIVDRQVSAFGLTEQMDRSTLHFSEILGRYPLRSLPRYNFGRPKTSPFTEEDRRFLESVTVADRMLWERYSKLFDSISVDYSVETFESTNLRSAIQAVRLWRTGDGFTYDMNAALVGDGFWGRDSPGGAECRRWSGPGEDSVLYLPAPFDGPIAVTLHVAGWQCLEARASFGAKVWGAPVDHHFASRDGLADLVSFSATPRDGVLKMAFHATPRTDEDCGKSESDGRSKGFSLKCITLAPL